MDDWKNIAIKLAQMGFPILGGALAGGTGAKAGSLIGDMLATALGVDNSPEGIGGAIAQNPGALQQLEQNPILPLLIKQAENEALAIEAERQIRMGEMAGSSLQRLWRPVNGLLFGLSLALMSLTACMQILMNGGAGLDKLAAIIGVVTLPWSGVVGLTAWGRTSEKIAGVVK